jgi:hypothetical protein
MTAKIIKMISILVIMKHSDFYDYILSNSKLRSIGKALQGFKFKNPLKVDLVFFFLGC